MKLPASVRERPGAPVLLAVLALAAILVAGYLHSYSRVSPADELQHLDYLDRAADFEIVSAGDRVQERAMRAQACRGLDAPFDAKQPDCDDADLDPEEFQEDGYNTAYVHPPTYYLITGNLGRVVEVAPGISSWVTAGRAVGALWLGLGLALTWLLFAELAVPIWTRVPLLVIMASAPVTLFASATVTPDATALAAGAGALLAVVRWESRRASWVWPAVAVGLAIACKATNAIGVLVAFAYLGIRFLQQRREESEPTVASDASAVDVTTRRDAHELARVVAGMLAGVAVVSVGWLAMARAAQEVDPATLPMLKRLHVDELEYDDVRADLTAGFTPLNGAYLPPFLRESGGVKTLNVWGNVVVGAGAVVGLAYSAARSRLRAISIAALIVAFVAGPALVVANYVLSDIYTPIPPRYALSLLPALLVACAVPLANRILFVAASVFAAWAAGSVLLAMM